MSRGFMDAFYSSALLVGAIIQSKGVSYYFILPEQCTLCPVHTVHCTGLKGRVRGELICYCQQEIRRGCKEC